MSTIKADECVKIKCKAVLAKRKTCNEHLNEIRQN